MRELNAKGHRTKAWTTVRGKVRAGVAWDKGHVYKLLGKPDGHAFVTDELARMNQDLTCLEERLTAVNAEHDLLTREPTTHETLVHELSAFDRIWDELFPAEQTRLTRLVVEKVTVMSDGIDLVLGTDGVDSVVAELVGGGIDYHRG